MMRVLVACEESQAVCKAFRELGHEAYSCDIQDQSGGHPEWHIRADVVPLLDGRCEFKTTDGADHAVPGKWDLIIAHPPCTYLTGAGSRWLYSIDKDEVDKARYEKGLEAKRFFLRMLNADCDKVAVENPAPMWIFKMPVWTQIIQPYEYGEPWSKRTCLWLKGLPKLRPTKIVDEHRPYTMATHGSKKRSKTFPGIAKAMAEQWGGI